MRKGYLGGKMYKLLSVSMVTATATITALRDQLILFNTTNSATLASPDSFTFKDKGSLLDELRIALNHLCKSQAEKNPKGQDRTPENNEKHFIRFKESIAIISEKCRAILSSDEKLNPEDRKLLSDIREQCQALSKEINIFDSFLKEYPRTMSLKDGLNLLAIPNVPTVLKSKLIQLFLQKFRQIPKKELPDQLDNFDAADLPNLIELRKSELIPATDRLGIGLLAQTFRLEVWIKSAPTSAPKTAPTKVIHDLLRMLSIRHDDEGRKPLFQFAQSAIDRIMRIGSRYLDGKYTHLERMYRLCQRVQENELWWRTLETKFPHHALIELMQYAIRQGPSTRSPQELFQEGSVPHRLLQTVFLRSEAVNLNQCRRLMDILPAFYIKTTNPALNDEQTQGFQTASKRIWYALRSFFSDKATKPTKDSKSAYTALRKSLEAKGMRDLDHALPKYMQWFFIVHVMVSFLENHRKTHVAEVTDHGFGVFRQFLNEAAKSDPLKPWVSQLCAH